MITPGIFNHRVSWDTRNLALNSEETRGADSLESYLPPTTPTNTPIKFTSPQVQTPYSDLETDQIETVWKMFQEDPDISHFIPLTSDMRPQQRLNKTRSFILNLPINKPLSKKIVSHFLTRLPDLSETKMAEILTTIQNEEQIASFLPQDDSMSSLEKIQTTCLNLLSHWKVVRLPKILTPFLFLTEIARLRKQEDAITLCKKLGIPFKPTSEDYSSELTSCLEAHKERLLQIKNLDLSGIYIKTFPKEIIPYLRNVKSLNFSNNNAVEPAPQIFLNLLKLPSLQTLNLSSNYIETFPFEYVKAIPLEVLDLSNNRIPSYEHMLVRLAASAKGIHVIL